MPFYFFIFLVPHIGNTEPSSIIPNDTLSQNALIIMGQKQPRKSAMKAEVPSNVTFQCQILTAN